MRTVASLALLAPLCLVLAVAPAQARPSASLCVDAIRRAEARTSWLPSGLLHAIALTESAHRPAGMRTVVPWPWTINSPKGSFYLASRREAVAKVEALQAMGVSNIDVGCMQINLHYHPDAFRSLDQAFQPASNVAYAVRFLTRLERDQRNLFDTVGRYHSGTPWRSRAYARKVFARWDQDGEIAAASKHGLGPPDSRRLLDRVETDDGRDDPLAGPGQWRRVYGTTTARDTGGRPPSVLGRGGTGSWLRGDDGSGRGVPGGPGQISFR